MKIVSIREAKADLTRLIEKASMGEQIIIARGKDRIVRLVPVRERKERRKLGILKGKLFVGPEFFEPLPTDELGAWEFRTPRR